MTFSKFLFAFIFTFLCCCVANIAFADDRSKFFDAMKLRDEKKYQEAISLLKQVKGQLSITAEFQIAQIYENDIGNYSLAIEKYNDLKRKYPNSLWSEHIERALSFLQSNVDFDGKPMNRYKIAEKLYAQQKQEEAIAVMIGVLEQFPTTKLADDVLYWVGEQYYFTQRYNEAINYLVKLIDQYQDSGYALEALKLLAGCYVLTKQENKAIETYKRILQCTLTKHEEVEIEYSIERLQKERFRRRGFYFSLALVGGIIIALVIKPRKWLSMKELKRLTFYFLIILIPSLTAYVLLSQTKHSIDLKAIHTGRHLVMLSLVCITAYFISSLINQKLSFHKPLFTFCFPPAITLTITITFLYIYLYLFDLLFIFGL